MPLPEPFSIEDLVCDSNTDVGAPRRSYGRALVNTKDLVIPACSVGDLVFCAPAGVRAIDGFVTDGDHLVKEVERFLAATSVLSLRIGDRNLLAGSDSLPTLFLTTVALDEAFGAIEPGMVVRLRLQNDTSSEIVLRAAKELRIGDRVRRLGGLWAVYALEPCGSVAA